MCTIDDTDVTGESLIPDYGTSDLSSFQKCRRCSQSKADVVLRRVDAYCKQCFLSYVNHKFRSMLGKSKLMRPSDNVLIGFSGGQSSSAMLHMLRMGTSDKDHKKLLYKMNFVYIDEGVLVNESDEERQKKIGKRKHFIESYKFPAYISTLSKALEEGSTLLDDNFSLNKEADDSLKRLLDGLDSLTSKEDLIVKFRQKILFAVAKELGCNKIFTGESQTGLAVKLLTNIALGRGEQLASEVGFQDDRYPGITLLRPMRDLEKKAIAYCNLFLGISCQNDAALSTKKPRNASIHRLTEHFIMGLHEEFPSTVSTVFRTGEKLSTSSSAESDLESCCLLCLGNIAKPIEESYSAVDATLFSQSVSRKSKTEKTGCCSDCSCSNQCQFSNQELRTLFCYGCLLIISELDSISLLPQNILAEANKRRSLANMRYQIADFLL